MNYVSKRDKRRRLLCLLLLSVGALICLFPFFWLIRTSLMDLREIYLQPPLLWSKDSQWANYKEIFSESFPFFKYVLNTMKILIPTTIGTVLTSSMAAYAFARLRFRHRKFWFTMCIATMMLPGAVTMIPGFIMWNKLGLINTYWPLIIPAFFGGGAFNIFLLRQFIMGVPKELDEAAYMEGASYFWVYWKIIMPPIRPGLIVVTVFTVLGCWNDFMGPLIMLYDPEKYTLALAMQQFAGSYGSNLGVIMAGAVVMTLPAVLLFLFCQKYFVNGMLMSGMK